MTNSFGFTAAPPEHTHLRDTDTYLAVVRVTLLSPSAHSWHFFLLKENTTTGSSPSFSSFLTRLCHWFLETREK